MDRQYDPIGHVLGNADPSGHTVPDGQLPEVVYWLLCPAAVRYNPAETLRDDAGPGQTCPGKQERGAADPAPQMEPVGQSVQADSWLAPDAEEYLPAGQAVMVNGFGQ